MAGTNPSSAAISGAAWTQPQPQAVLGLSSTAVYGSAFTASIPQAFQLATGGLFKLVVDPTGFLAAFPEVKEAGGLGAQGLMSLFSNGAQGNVQLTLGTLANVSMGLAYDIHIGDKVKIESKDKIAPRLVSFLAGALLAVGGLLFHLLYDMMTADDDRATLVITFQTTVQAVVATLIAIEVAYYQLDKTAGYLYKDIFVALSKVSPADAEVQVVSGNIVTSLVGGMLLGAAIAPPIIDSQRESYLDQVMSERKDPSTGKTIGTDGSGAYMSVPTSGTGS
jgi:hypothetical protein